MRPSRISSVLAVVLLGTLAVPLAGAVEEAPKTLPTLIIKGEVVSVDANDPAVSILKVKDRYGFETPIHLTQDTKISQGETAVPAASLAPGSTVEVEYNFDINTAKRHAVRVDVGPTAAPAPAAAEAALATEAVSTEATVAPEAAPSDAPAEAEAAPAEPAAAEPAAESAPAPQ